ncbi:uncharacterized protein LOC126602828 [Malus sylvestris]|uniref:uncharacterized protein LOC126602828 n=1 Tax=Malus sylvestris TaxID=3752 RepID=UPI0021AD0CA2|nr:uncharacterized protein LOC126602828 [Malus sylvestris]
MPKFKQWHRATNLKNPDFCMGMLFPNKQQLNEAILYYTVKNGRNVWFKKNDKERIRAIYMKGCPFVIYGSRLHESTTFQIKTFEMNHVCTRDENVFWLNSKFLAERYANELMIDPDWSIELFRPTIQKDYRQEVTTQQIYRARQRAEKLNRGTWVEQYNKLEQYAAILKQTNPGSIVFIKTQMRGDIRIFQRMYICFDACKIGFKQGCRPVIGLDGYFVKGQHPGQILAAVGIDGNNGMFPIAYAVVEIENQSTWEWFLEILIDDLSMENSATYAFITNKQKGLGNAIQRLMPNAEHRHCVRHLYNNFKKKYSGLALKQTLWEAARATTIPWWQDIMDNLQQENKDACDWLHVKPAYNWSRSHFRTYYKCDILLNNLCEAFNASIVKARDKPILTML